MLLTFERTWQKLDMGVSWTVLQGNRLCVLQLPLGQGFWEQAVCVLPGHCILQSDSS